MFVKVERDGHLKMIELIQRLRVPLLKTELKISAHYKDKVYALYQH